MTTDFPLHVSILATPQTVASPLVSIYDVLNMISDLHAFDSAVPADPPYRVEIVSETDAPVMTASKIPIVTHRSIHAINRTDMVIIPSIMTDVSTWPRGGFPHIASWLRSMHEAGAMICTTCSGGFLLAESGLLEGKEATMHWSHAKAFQTAFPEIKLSLEKMLVTAGGRSELVMSGASTSWHDLVLYLVARQLGYPAAYAVAKYFAMQWHSDGQAPFIIFTPPLDHGDNLVLKAQQWLQTNYSAASPVEAMISLADAPERTFKRRFTKATGLSPIQYVQHLRIDQAKRWLESCALSVDEISWKVGYEDPAFFRRLFKRLTGMPPGAYRKTFTLPQFESF
jgi:transcriptional regulator GlxA family with amidase domain